MLESALVLLNWHREIISGKLFCICICSVCYWIGELVNCAVQLFSAFALPFCDHFESPKVGGRSVGVGGQLVNGSFVSIYNVAHVPADVNVNIGNVTPNTRSNLFPEIACSVGKARKDSSKSAVRVPADVDCFIHKFLKRLCETICTNCGLSRHRDLHEKKRI